MINIISIILISISVYLAIGALITTIKLPAEDKKGGAGCFSILLGTTAWPIICLMVLVGRIIIWRNKRK